jgi:hypothetical protein
VQNKNGNGKSEEKWMELCGQAATEQDPKKLSALFAGIISALEEKHLRECPSSTLANPALTLALN